MMSILIGVGIGLVIAGVAFFLLKGVIWHTYHGDIVELVIKIALTFIIIGIAIAGITALIL